MKATLGTPLGTVIAHQDPSSAASEAFRVLRTNLQFLGVDRPLKSLLVTSATPGEGKTTTSSNLAVSFAQTGARVCLVDADLRRPTVAKTFGLDNWRGLTTALIGQSSLEDCLKETAVANLTVLTSGPIPPNPAELLGSTQMERMISELSQRFDHVVFDSPPVLAVTDAAVLASRVTAVVLVARAGVVGYPEAKRAKETLSGVKANLVGVVLDGVGTNGEDGYYYYYSYSSSQTRRRMDSRRSSD